MSKKRIYLILFVLTIIALAIPGLASAGDSAVIENYSARVNINAAGDATFTETVDYYVTDRINGFTRDVDVLGTAGLTGLSVGLSDGNGQTRIFNYVDSARKGDSGVFTSEILDNGNIRFYIYMPSNEHDRVELVYKYTLAGACERYADVARFKHILIGDAWELDINRYECDVYLDNASAGDVTLEITKPGMSHIATSQDDPSSGNAIVHISGTEGGNGEQLEINLLFPQEAISSAAYAENAPMKAKLEAEVAAHAEGRASNMKRTLINLAAIVALTCAVCAVAYALIDKEPYADKSAFALGDPLPDDTPPAEVAGLINKTTVVSGGDTLTMVLMDLVRKGCLKLELPQRTRSGLSGSDKDARSIVFRATGRQPELKYEADALNMLLDTGDDDNSFTLGGLLEMNEREGSDARRFQNALERWEKKVSRAIDAHNWLAHHKLERLVLALILGAVAVYGFAMFCIALDTFGVSGCNGLVLLGSALALAGVVYVLCAKQRTREGAISYGRWSVVKDAFERRDALTNAEIARLTPALIDAYMVYAIPLRAQKELAGKLKAVNANMIESLTDAAQDTLYGAMRSISADYGGYGDDYNFWFYLALQGQMRTCSASHSSSSSGSGGGGGGSGAGGGGGGGTF